MRERKMGRNSRLVGQSTKNLRKHVGSLAKDGLKIMGSRVGTCWRRYRLWPEDGSSSDDRPGPH